MAGFVFSNFSRKYVMGQMSRKELFDRAIWCRVSPFLAYFFFMILAGLLSKLGWSDHELRLLYVVKIAVVAGILWHLKGVYVELRFPSGVGTLTWGISIAAGVFVFVAWINLNAAWMQIGTSDGFNPRGDGGMDWVIVFIRLAGAALVVPLMEELFWRSFLLRWIVNHDFVSVGPARVGYGAFIVTTVFFAFEHNLWLAGLVAGAIYNLLYMRSGTLWSPVLAHAVTNALLGIWVVSTSNWSYW